MDSPECFFGGLTVDSPAFFGGRSINRNCMFWSAEHG